MGGLTGVLSISTGAARRMASFACSLPSSAALTFARSISLSYGSSDLRSRTVTVENLDEEFEDEELSIPFAVNSYRANAFQQADYLRCPASNTLNEHEKAHLLQHLSHMESFCPWGKSYHTLYDALESLCKASIDRCASENLEGALIELEGMISEICSLSNNPNIQELIEIACRNHVFNLIIDRMSAEIIEQKQFPCNLPEIDGTLANFATKNGFYLVENFEYMTIYKVVENVERSLRRKYPIPMPRGHGKEPYQLKYVEGYIKECEKNFADFQDTYKLQDHPLLLECFHLKVKEEMARNWVDKVRDLFGPDFDKNGCLYDDFYRSMELFSQFVGKESDFNPHIEILTAFFGVNKEEPSPFMTKALKFREDARSVVGSIVSSNWFSRESLSALTTAAYVFGSPYAEKLAEYKANNSQWMLLSNYFRSDKESNILTAFETAALIWDHFKD